MLIQTYHEFVIFTDDVKKDEHQMVKSFSVRVLDAPVGLDRFEKEIVEIPNDFTLHRRMLENREFDQDIKRQISFGERLANLLLPNGSYARKKFYQSFAWLREGEGLRLRLRLADELAELPWEFMYIQEVRGERTPSGFLALDPRISIVRHSSLGPAEGFRSSDNRRIIIAMASPRPYQDYPKLVNLPHEQKLIKEALSRVPGIDVDYLPTYLGNYEDDIPGTKIEDLLKALMQTTDIFHFSGHGEFVKSVGPGGESIIGQGGIILANEKNQAVHLPADRLLELLRGKGVSLVVLGACETGRRDSFNVWSSVTASLLKGGISAVVAMQFTIKDDLMAAFMGALYQGLVTRMTIDEAVALGRATIRIKALEAFDVVKVQQPIKDVRDWGVPVLYLRTSGGRVFNPVTDKEALQAAEQKGNARDLVRLGMRAFYQRNYDEALAYLRQATQADQEYSDAFRAIVLVQQTRANIDFQARNYDAAISKLVDARTAAMHTDPLDPQALALRGFTAKVMGMVAGARNDRVHEKEYYTEAARIFEHVTTLDPANTSTHVGLGNVQFLLGNLDAAIAAYNRAIAILPLYTAAHHDLAIAYEKKMISDPDHASEWCRRALAAWRKASELVSTDPGFPADYNARVILRRIRWLEEKCG